MKFNFSLSKAAAVLFAAAVFFIAANIAADNFIVKKDEPVPQISGGEINNKFLSALQNVGIKKEWISEVPVKQKKDDSLKFNYKVDIPADLPIPAVLYELNNLLSEFPVEVHSSEEGINGKTIFKVFSGNELKLTSRFNYNPELFRENKRGAVILSGVNELNGDELNKLLAAPEQFAAVVSPDKTSGDLIKKLRDNSKEYIIFLDDDITDLEFKLKPGFDKKRILLVVKSILEKFNTASFLMIDEESSLYNSAAYKIIKKEFDDRKVILIKRNEANILKGDDEKLKAEFLSYMKNSGEKPELFFIDAENYFGIQPEIIKLRKIGYKFINPSLALKEIFNREESLPSN